MILLDYLKYFKILIIFTENFIENEFILCFTKLLYFHNIYYEKLNIDSV